MITMNEISQSQAELKNVKIAAAFRYAYRRAKLWKSWVWSLTILLAALQLFSAINHQHLKDYLPDNLAAMVVTVSLLSMLMGTLGRHFFINKYIDLGSKLQRLHDFEILGIGTKPTPLEVSQSQIERLSKKWLDNNPKDQPNLSEWWPNSISELPEQSGIALCLLSTFKWENELRKKYSIVIILSGITAGLASLSLMHILEYRISDYIVNILTPMSPLLALLIDEFLLNRSALQVAQESSQQALGLWNKYFDAPEKEGGKEELNQLSYLWSSYRSTASPIFDWLYWITQKTMNKDMIIDANALISEYEKNARSTHDD